MMHFPLNPSRTKRRNMPPTALAAVLILAILPSFGCQRAPEPPLLPERSAQEELDYQAGRMPDQSSAEPAASGRPRLVALGAGQCIPCKKMQPDLAELRENYSGAMELVYIDVWKDREAGAQYGIQSIPTQIFYDPSGNELFRHVGYYSKDDILAKWQELGLPLQPTPADERPLGNCSRSAMHAREAAS